MSQTTETPSHELPPYAKYHKAPYKEGVKPDYAPLRYLDGYLPIEDFGLIGDLATAALVGRDGTIAWFCAPFFDSPPIFAGILDRNRGGHFTVAPEGLEKARQYYVEDSGVLVTEMTCPGGTVRLTDALTFRAGADLAEGTPVERNELLRCVTVLEGNVRLKVACRPRGGAKAEKRSGGLRVHLNDRPNEHLHLLCSRPLEGLDSTFELSQGDEFYLRLTWGTPPHRYQPLEPSEVLKSTVASWQRWLKTFSYEGPQRDLVRRSAITLKMLDYSRSGAIVAAPTSSLPETLGGERNWDYRYAWVRDAAFSVYALRRVGFPHEARGFLGWVLDAVERHNGPKILYTVEGDLPPEEVEDKELEGYRKSPPVRWYNGAADQIQHDVYGEIIDCAYLWAMGGGEIDMPLWEKLHGLIEKAREVWRTPDQGIWEVRSSGRHFTYSVAMCHVALDRGARLAKRYGLPGDIEGWRQEAEAIREAILEGAWNEELGSITEHLEGDGGLDASLLTLPMRRVVPAEHPKMVATTEAVVRTLGTDGDAHGEGLIYRYLPDKSPDGLAGEEGAFVLCSFWVVDNLAYQGRLEEAEALYHSLCARANHLGLMSEQIDPHTGLFLGNFPQAFSHIGIIASGVNLMQQRRKREAAASGG
jgi:GH15 family glucan-1,4-alpha-glucosidase